MGAARCNTSFNACCARYPCAYASGDANANESGQKVNAVINRRTSKSTTIVSSQVLAPFKSSSVCLDVLGCQRRCGSLWSLSKPSKFHKHIERTSLVSPRSVVIFQTPSAVGFFPSTWRALDPGVRAYIDVRV